jgi:hypothetical protein
VIDLRFDGMDEEIASIVSRMDALPNYIARKHAQAAVKRVMKYAIPALKKNTPRRRSFTRFGGGRGGREYTATKVKGGTLRQSVISKASYLRPKGGGGATIYGAVGYSTKAAPAESSGPGITQSRKAIWLEFGTVNAFARGMVEMTMKQIGRPAAQKLAAELAVSIEKAAAELASKKNPGMSARGRAAGL